MASSPTFLLLKERARPQPARQGDRVRAFARVARDAAARARSSQDLLRFLVCIVFYQAGMQTVIALAAIYAQEAMGFTTQDTIMLILLVNITAASGRSCSASCRTGSAIADARADAARVVRDGAGRVSAHGADRLLGRREHRGPVPGREPVRRPRAGRYLSPPIATAEFFGLWGLAVKLASILGPLTYGAVTWLTGGDHRSAMLVTGAFFVLGLVVLKGVDAERGRRAAAAAL